jgi:hypothetical protein
MKFEIWVKGHSGVAEFRDRMLAEIEANTPKEALEKLSQINKNVKYIEKWGRYSYGLNQLEVREK